MNQSLQTITSLLTKVRALGADSADAVMFETVDINVSQRLRKPEGLERSENKAVGLRAFVGNRQAIVSATDILPASLTELAERVVAMAKAAPPDADSTLAPPSLLAKNIPELELYDADEPSAGWLEAQCKDAEEAALAVKGITNSEGAGAHYSQSHVSLGIADAKGVRFLHSYPMSYFSLAVSVLAESGGNMERDDDFTSAHRRSDLLAAKDIGLSAANRALRRLNPRKVASCRVPVVFDPRVSKQLVGIFAGAISGSSVARGTSFLKADMGNLIFPKSVSIIDDPHIKRGLGSKPFDAEGVAGQKMPLIENGELKSWLLDTRTANKLKLTSTGHATRGIASPPSPSPTNLYMQKGSVPPQALIADIKNGLYVTETFGMGVSITTGDYSQGASGFWIENGEIAYPVSEITIAGHLREMFKTATPADDLVFRYGTNAPTLRVDSMTVAGV